MMQPAMTPVVQHPRFLTALGRQATVGRGGMYGICGGMSITVSLRGLRGG